MSETVAQLVGENSSKKSSPSTLDKRKAKFLGYLAELCRGERKAVISPRSKAFREAFKPSFAESEIAVCRAIVTDFLASKGDGLFSLRDPHDGAFICRGAILPTTTFDELDKEKNLLIVLFDPGKQPA